MLNAKDLSFAHPGGKTLLDGVSLQLDAKERVALVGENGAGKSTLLTILASERPPDGGEVHRVRGAAVGLLAQQPRLDPERTVTDTVRSALGGLLAMIEEHEQLCAKAAEDPAAAERVSELTERIEARGGFATEHRVEEVLHRLGVKAREQEVGSLSGGEQRRVDLARLLLSAPDALLLDEPTNHLDVGAISWLAAELVRWPGAVAFVSHDRAFMDEVATVFLELENGKLFRHDPPYENFLEGRLVRHEVEGRTAHRRSRLLARELAWMKTSPKARTGKQKARIGRAQALVDDLAADVSQKREKTLAIRRERADRLGKTILELEGLALARGGVVLFSGLELKVTKGERWGVVGKNGCGKTSLLKALLGELEPHRGSIKRGKNTEVALLDQHRAALDPNATLGEAVAPEGDYVHIDDERIHVATYLESFLFDPKDRPRKVGTLSGGEQNRLHLARVLQQGANCLLLDEPTNDLDVTTLGVLEDLLFELEGVAFIVSHDRAFLDRVCTGILAFEPIPDAPAGGPLATVTPVQGDYTHYERMQAEKTAQDKARAAESAPSSTSAQPSSGSKKAKAKTKRSYKEEQEYQRIEGEVLELEARKEEVEAALADGSLFKDDPEQARALTEELSALGPKIEALYARWQQLEDIGGGG